MIKLIKITTFFAIVLLWLPNISHAKCSSVLTKNEAVGHIKIEAYLEDCSFNRKREGVKILLCRDTWNLNTDKEKECLIHKKTKWNYNLTTSYDDVPRGNYNVYIKGRFWRGWPFLYGWVFLHSKYSHLTYLKKTFQSNCQSC